MNRKYIIPSYEKDITHIIREDMSWWLERFKKAGFKHKISSYYMLYIRRLIGAVSEETDSLSCSSTLIRLAMMK